VVAGDAVIFASRRRKVATAMATVATAGTNRGCASAMQVN